jgi:hypothetical protein
VERNLRLLDLSDDEKFTLILTLSINPNSSLISSLNPNSSLNPTNNILFQPYLLHLLYVIVEVAKELEIC